LNIIPNYDKGGDFIYDIDVLYGGQKCKLTGVAGVHDPLSITPDGNNAVVAFASGYRTPRHVVVMRFKPQHCEAVSIQHIYFEEKSAPHTLSLSSETNLLKVGA
jgi:hypothetical protein